MFLRPVREISDRRRGHQIIRGCTPQDYSAPPNYRFQPFQQDMDDPGIDQHHDQRDPHPGCEQDEVIRVGQYAHPKGVQAHGSDDLGDEDDGQDVRILVQVFEI